MVPAGLIAIDGDDAADAEADACGCVVRDVQLQQVSLRLQDARCSNEAQEVVWTHARFWIQQSCNVREETPCNKLLQASKHLPDPQSC